MIDKIKQIFLLRQDGRSIPIFGEVPDAQSVKDAEDMLQARPAARKVGTGFVVSVPLHKLSDAGDADTALWAIWHLDFVPPVLELPRVLSNLADLSRGFLMAAKSQAGPVSGGAPADAPQGNLAPFEAALADLPARKRRDAEIVTAIVTARLASLLTVGTQCSSIVAVAIRAGRIRKVWPSDDRVKPVIGQLRAYYAAQLASARGNCRIDANSDAPADFEATLILQRLGGKSLDLYFPSVDSGYGVMLLDASDADHRLATLDAAAILQLSRPISTAPMLTQNRKRALLAAAAVLAIWLAWPAPNWLTVTGTSLPDSTLTVALPSDATLQQMFVRVGARVEKGAPIAQLFSAQLEEMRSQEALSIKVEELAAQAAMSENNFGAFQLAEQRGEIAKTRLAQVEARIAQLSVVAPADGLIVAAVPDSTKGAALPQGTALAEVQTEPKFLVRLSPARVDARLLAVDQAGYIYFRGLSDRTYELRLITPPVASKDQRTGAEQLESYAQIITKDDGRLMGGLSGYARIAAPRQMRVLSYTRYIREFIRVRAWNYLGLPL